MSKDHEQQQLDGLTTMLVIMTTIVLALNAWRAALTADTAAGTDYQGIRALTKAESVKTIDTVDSYEDYRLFLQYKINSELGDALEDYEELTADREESRQLAQLDVSFLDETKSSRYLDRSGGYAIDRQMGEKWAAASRKHELKHEARFQEAARYRKIKKSQQKAGFVLTLALLVLTLCRLFHGSVERVLFAVGALLFSGGSLWALMAELSK